MAPLPLFPGVPGGPELIVVLLLMVALFGVPVVIAVLGWRYISDDEQVEELEARVRELEAQVGGAGGTTAEGDRGDTGASGEADVEETDPGDESSR